VTDPRDPASSASGPGDNSAGASAFGGQRPADSASGPASADPPDADPAREADWQEGLVDPLPDAADDDIADAELIEVVVDSVARERDEFRDALIRLQADFENYKKRVIKQQTDLLERAAEGLVDKLLPVLDTVDLALAHGGGEEIKQLAGALSSILDKEGLERIDPVGERFDPTLHDAVAHEPGDGGQQEVVEVLRAGYRWKGRVLRPAMVKVRG
jgi:molecular chaperone GrpE